MTTAYLIDNIPARQLDDNGNPVSGAKLHTWIAGTTTNLATYTDATATTPLPNPIVSDLHGFFPQVWGLGAAYDLEARKADDISVLWQVSNINPGASSIALAAFQALLATPSGASMIGTAFGALSTDLAAARPVARGGTGASTSGGALTNLGLIDMGSQISVTGTTALTSTALGKCVTFSDSGSPANFTVTLPAAAPVGSLIMVRISATGTKLYTINGNDANIDGSLTRVMWAGESALLIREAANWAKISGRTRPLAGGMQRLSSQAGVTAATDVQVAFTSAFGDLSGLNFSFNSGTANMQCVRPGNYQITGNLSITGTGIVGQGAYVALGQNSVHPTSAPTAFNNAVVGTGAARFMVNVSGLYNLALGDGMGLIGNMGSGATGIAFEYTAGTIVPTLTYQEIPTW